MQRFLVDLMLMRLGRWLRLLGGDVANPEGGGDDEILLQAKKESRTIITRDKRLFLACRAAGAKGLLISSSKISDQLLEMAKAGVPLRLDPQRCTLCNGLLEEMKISREGAASIESLPKRLWRCSQCKKLYWEGCHWKRIEMMLEGLATRGDSAN